IEVALLSTKSPTKGGDESTSTSTATTTTTAAAAAAVGTQGDSSGPSRDEEEYGQDSSVDTPIVSTMGSDDGSNTNINEMSIPDKVARLKALIRSSTVDHLRKKVEEAKCKADQQKYRMAIRQIASLTSIQLTIDPLSLDSPTYIQSQVPAQYQLIPHSQQQQ